MKQASLQTIVSLLGIGSIAVFFISLTGLSGWWFTWRMQSDYREWAAIVAANLATQSQDSVLTGDVYLAHRVLAEAVKSNRRARYAYILLQDQEVVASTFAGGFPPGLLAMRQRHGSEPLQYRSGEDHIVEVGVPLYRPEYGHLYLGTSQTALIAQQRRFVVIMGVVLGLLLLGTFWVARWIGLAVGQPLGQLAAQLRAVPSGTLKPEAIEVRGTAEVRGLALAVRQMVADLRRLESDARAAQARMVSAERLAALGELAAGMTHEILNPLDGVLECARVLEKTLADDPRAGRYLGLIQKGLDRIHGVMRQMLLFARGGPRDELVAEACCLRPLVEEVMLLLSPRATTRGVAIMLRVPADLGCQVDRKLFEQALLNLLLNAINAVEPVAQPRIDLVAHRDGDWVHVHLDDNGPGVPIELRQRIFTPFFSTREPGEGTGLGLSISRQIVQRCGGDLILEDAPSPLGGARFTLLVPAAAPVPDPASLETNVEP